MEHVRTDPEGRRRRTTGAAVTAILALFGVALFLGVGFAQVGVAPGPTTGGAAPVHVLATPATQIYINRSQSAGTYVKEFVSLNNSSTLTQLPYANTAIKSANDCRWATVLNMTTKVDAFHSIIYQELTSANGSGLVASSYRTPAGGYGSGVFAASFSFKICGGTAEWVAYQQWTFTVYGFFAPRLTNQTTMKIVYLTPNGGTRTYYNTTFPFGANFAVSRQVPTNYSTQFALPTSVTGPVSTDFAGVTTTPSWAFQSASLGSPATNTSTSAVLTFAAQGALYANWTAAYQQSNATGGNVVSAFFETSDAFIVAQATTIIILVALLVIVVAAVAVARRSRHRRKA